ncbi:MAG: YggT family protein [Leptolyngbya sp. SIO1E4]|nr:YggT family protein [Leptolyngbya sp. SIO1E4]
MGSSVLGMFAQAFAIFLNIYFVLLIIRILLSWFPNVDWFSQPFATLSQLTDPYLNLFRSLIPPLGGIDFSPILAFLVLRIVADGANQVATTIAMSAF